MIDPISGMVNEGSDVTFTCRPETNGSPTFAWKKDNIPIVGETGATLRKTSVQPEDGGTYVCETKVSGKVAASTGSSLKVICKYAY